MKKQATFPTVSEILEDEQTLIGRLSDLADLLDSEEHRNRAIDRLHELADCLAESKNGLLTLHTVALPGAEPPIRLLLHPAVFSPEQWGRTFAEGLLKTPEIFDGAHLVELGCGSGWISLLLLMRTRVKEVLGLDINEIAVLLARLNAWLNGAERDGTLKLSQFGVPIVQAFRACRSDLLEEPLSRGEYFEHVIGCIPQVLHPDPAAMDRSQARMTDKDLYDLSNYCFQQGILEDRFGLPLIARALEQAQLCLKPGGKVTLILGGRPGPAAIESMFRRRGFEPALVWSRRIQQADDTDLASLVALEKQHGIEFNFFMSRDSGLPVSASTAVKMLDKGQSIYHDLLVYQAYTRWEKPTFGLLRNLHALGLDSLRQELDLSRVSEEQISFLNRFSSDIQAARMLPYPHERGDFRLRDRLARFLNVYCHFSIDPDHLFIGPEREQLVAMVLHMVADKGRRVLVSRSLLPVYEGIFNQAQLDIIVGNDDLAELMRLDDLLSPDLILFSADQLKHPSPIVMSAITRQAAAHCDRWYLIDDSEHFQISSELNSNALVRLASQQALPENLVLLYGLTKNTVFPDLQLSFLLHAPRNKWIAGLEVGAELSYSRIAWTTQLYYEWLFDELLEFAFPDEPAIPPVAGPAATADLVDSFSKVASDPVFAPKPVGVDKPDLIRMDYGEFEMPVPDLLVKGIVKGFLEAPVEGLPALVADRVTSYLRATRGADVPAGRIVLGQGVYPLLGALIRCLREKLGRAPVVALPDGTYGPCYPLVAYHGGLVERIPTDPSNGFLLKMENLSGLPQKPDLLWLTQPNNPSGLYYEPNAVQALMTICNEKQIYILADEIFFLLSDTSMGKWTPPEFSFGSMLASDQAKNLFLVDGLSKAFAAGGLRCGFMVTPDEDFARRLQRQCWLPPKSTLRAWDALYSAFLEYAPHQLLDIAREHEEIERYLMQARERLCNQRDRLVALLQRYDLDDRIKTSNRGGLFVLARLSDRVEQLARQAHILVNPPEWGRTDGMARLCFSLSQPRFEEALRRLEAFLAS